MIFNREKNREIEYTHCNVHDMLLLDLSGYLRKNKPISTVFLFAGITDAAIYTQVTNGENPD